MSVIQNSTVCLLPQKPVYSIQEVMDILGVCRDTIEQEMKSGRLACKRLGKRRIVIPFASLSKYLETFDQYETEVENGLPW